MAAELESGGYPLPQLFERTAAACSGEVSRFFLMQTERINTPERESFSQIWSEDVRLYFPSLGQDEQQTLLRLGLVLGRYDRLRQAEEIRSCEGILRDRLDALRLAYPGDRRAFLGSICAAGVLLIIVLM